MQSVLPFRKQDATSRRLRVVILGSGSGGNAVFIEADEKRILVDAGFSCRELERRMKRVGVEASSISALLLTHEHSDHVSGAARFAKKYGVPVYASRGTFAGTELPEEVMARAETIESGRPFEVAGFQVEAFQIPHDAREPVGFVIEDSSGRRVGLCADLGCRSKLAWGRLRDLDLLLLETNHDLDMLRNGPYPWHLKQRVAGRHGHLSNEDAAEGLPELLSDRLKWVAAYHLSRVNNSPALAAALLGEALERAGSRAGVLVTDQFEPTPWLEV